jgi:hypothetical protein
MYLYLYVFYKLAGISFVILYICVNLAVSSEVNPLIPVSANNTFSFHPISIQPQPPPSLDAAINI